MGRHPQRNAIGRKPAYVVTRWIASGASPPRNDSHGAWQLGGFTPIFFCMTDLKTSQAKTSWDKVGPDPLDRLIHLSHLMGHDTRLVQPGGGNTSTKEGDTLLVKGSGTDLRTINREGFTRLSLPRLAALRDTEAMTDAEMMRFMAGCMVAEGPAPSVETPLHSLLPHRVIAHTHDVATMSLTNIRDAEARRLVDELFSGRIVYVPYVRPGFPLAQMVGRMVGRADGRTGGQIPADAIGMTLAHHGLVVWGDDAEECYARLLEVTGRMDEYLERRRKERGAVSPPVRPSARPTVRPSTEIAELVLPVIRGALGKPDRVILHFDDGDDVLSTLAGERMQELVRRGMATPEHLLRAGRLPLWLDIDAESPAGAIVESVRGQLGAARLEYEQYHGRNAGAGERPLDDWAKVVLVPGVGVVTAFTDKRNAVTANLCYRATLEAITNAEAVDRFEFIPERDVYEFERWPLERRKIEEQVAKERATRLLPRHVAVIIGGGSGIGAAAARRFAEEGAHVVVADLDGAMSEGVAREVASRFPGRAIAAAVDVRSDASLDELFRRAVLEFGGLDCLFYTAGLPPRFAPITEITREDLQRQLEVHYLGAVAAIGRAAAIMRRQGLGGSIVASVSKAALVPGRDAVAYGGSKAALLRPDRDAALPSICSGARLEPGSDDGGTARRVSKPQPDGCDSDSAGGGGRSGRTARKRPVPVYDRRHSYGGWGTAGSLPKVTGS
jgi:rhamnose utilization protein RhaD (predicted bifunctional aldolase and dehydrogenase)